MFAFRSRRRAVRDKLARARADEITGYGLQRVEDAVAIRLGRACGWEGLAADAE